MWERFWLAMIESLKNEEFLDLQWWISEISEACEKSRWVFREQDASWICKESNSLLKISYERTSRGRTSRLRWWRRSSSRFSLRLALVLSHGGTATACSQSHRSPLSWRRGDFMSFARPVSTLYSVRTYELLTACARSYAG